MRRIYVDPKDISSDKVVFGPSGTRYLQRVLRLKRGDLVRVFDGRCEYVVRLEGFGSGKALGLITHKTIPHQERPTITLAFCCVRPGPMEEILRHGTELGISRFVPLLSVRCMRRPQERKTRWESIVKGASAQAGRVDVPAVAAPVPLTQFLNTPYDDDLAVFLSPTAEALPMPLMLEHERPHRVAILVGPEGGWDPGEEALALERGYQPASLGPTILRTETAALIAAGLTAVWCHWRTPCTATSDNCQ